MSITEEEYQEMLKSNPGLTVWNPPWLPGEGKAHTKPSPVVSTVVKIPRRRRINKETLMRESEDDFRQKVEAYAHLTGWLVEHKRPARLADGSWRTAITGDPGGPDDLFARGGIALLVEFKSDAGKLTPEQESWKAAAGVVTWRPRDFEEIIERLKQAKLP